MAIVDDKVYANSSTDIKQAAAVGGTDVIALALNFEIDSGDSSGSTYRMAKLPGSYIPLQLEMNHDGITGVTDADIGFYLDEEFGGTVKDADVLLDGADISSAAAVGSEVNCLTALGQADIGSDIATLVDDKISEQQTYDLVLTINANASAAGTVAIRGLFINGAS